MIRSHPPSPLRTCRLPDPGSAECLPERCQDVVVQQGSPHHLPPAVVDRFPQRVPKCGRPLPKLARRSGGHTPHATPPPPTRVDDPVRSPTRTGAGAQPSVCRCARPRKAGKDTQAGPAREGRRRPPSRAQDAGISGASPQTPSLASTAAERQTRRTLAAPAP